MKNDRKFALFLTAFFLMVGPIWAEDRISAPSSPRDEIIELLRQQVGVLQAEVADLKLENTELTGQVEMWQRMMAQKDVEIGLYKANLNEKQAMIEAHKEQVDLLSQSMKQREELMMQLAKSSKGNSGKSSAWLIKFAGSIPTVAAIVAMGMASHN
jgi:chromosome segregation ATPase